MVHNPEKQAQDVPPLKPGIAIQSSIPLYTKRHHNQPTLQSPEHNHAHNTIDEKVNQIKMPFFFCEHLLSCSIRIPYPMHLKPPLYLV
jgi:hypothetical protein